VFPPPGATRNEIYQSALKCLERMQTDVGQIGPRPDEEGRALLARGQLVISDADRAANSTAGSPSADSTRIDVLKAYAQLENAVSTRIAQLKQTLQGGGPAGAPGTAAPGHGAAPSTSQAGASQASPGSAPGVAVVAKSATAPSAFAESPVERLPGGASGAAGSQGAQEVIQIRELYQKFVQSYQSKNLNGVLRAMTPQWQASDGSGLADLEDTLRNSFRVFDVIQFRIEGLQIQKSGSDTYNVSYAATLSGRINRLNVKHEETSTVQDLVKLTPDGPRIASTKGNVTIRPR
jgi:hypothetical protein